MLEKLNLCRCFFCVQSVFIVSSKLKAFNKFKPGNFPRVVPFHKTGRCFGFLWVYRCTWYISKLETDTFSYVLPVTYLHLVRGSQPIQNDTRYQPLQDSLLLHGLSFCGVIPTQRLEVWTNNVSRSQISDNKRVQKFPAWLTSVYNKIGW